MIAIFLVVLMLLPVLLLVWLCALVYNLFAKERKLPRSNPLTVIDTGSHLKIAWHWINVNEIPDFLYDYFDPYPLRSYETDPAIEFFEGYFTKFQVERSDGIFVQKVELNEAMDEVQALPLYFFRHATQEVEMIRDLKGYEIMSTEGSPDDLVITVFSQGEELEIRLTQ